MIEKKRQNQSILCILVVHADIKTYQEKIHCDADGKDKGKYYWGYSMYNHEVEGLCVWKKTGIFGGGCSARKRVKTVIGQFLSSF